MNKQILIVLREKLTDILTYTTYQVDKNKFNKYDWGVDAIVEGEDGKTRLLLIPWTNITRIEEVIS